MKKSYESERIYEINSEEWFLGRMLGMPQSQIQKSLEKTKPQHIAANHSLQMIDNLEKKLSELRGEIHQTMRKGPEEDERYNPVNDMPTGIAYGKEGNPINFPVGNNNGWKNRVVPNYPEDPRSAPENWNNDQDPRLQRTNIAQAPSMSIDDIINGGRGIGRGVGKEMPPANTDTIPARPRPTYKPSEGPLVTDDDENLANTAADYGKGSNESATRYGPRPTYKPSDGTLVTDDDENLANTAANYGKGSNESARRYGPPSMPTANRGPFPEIADAAKTGIKRVGNAVNTGLKTAATVKNTISGGLNEIKDDMTGNSVGKSNSYRLLEDDGYVLRRGLTAENYEMIKGLAVVLRISETEVLHRLEKNGAL